MNKIAILKSVLIGFVMGAAATAVLLVWFAASPSSHIPLQLARVVAWLGFTFLSGLYEGFPANASPLKMDLLLVLFGGVQWAVVAFAVALLKMAVGLLRRLHLGSSAQ